MARVVLGTAALDDPGLVRQAGRRRSPAGWPSASTTGATPDGRTEVAVRGWEQGSGRTVGELLAELAGAGLAAVVVTAIERDGTLAGPDLDGLADVLGVDRAAGHRLGRRRLVADIEALAAWLPSAAARRRPRRLAGAITGKALVDGRMTVEEGVAACARSG